MFELMNSVKCSFHIYFTVLQDYKTLIIGNNSTFFRIIDVAMANNHFSALHSDKMTCKILSIKFPSKLLLVKHRFTLTYFTFNMKLEFAFGIFEMMMVLK